MGIFWLFFGLILLCIYVLCGLYVSEGIDSTTSYIFTWVIYSCLWLVVSNVFILAYFWGTIRLKTGPYGIRGMSGEQGEQGIEGSCGVSATQSEGIRQINQLIDGLYNDKTGKNILREDTQTFPNNYLSNKIASISGSKQYKVMFLEASTLDKTSQEVINYIKGIWKTWFELLYTGNPEWFTDTYGDEDYTWTGSNPFDEIKKYDMYYWGLSRSFRPLKAELCRTTASYRSSKFPYKEPEQPNPRLKIIKTNDYQRLAGDNKTKGVPDASWFRAKPVKIGNETYYPVGDIITEGNSDWNNQKGGNTIIGDMVYKSSEWTGPDKTTILVAGDVVSPEGYYTFAWNHGAEQIATGSLLCPKGYESIGDVLGNNYSAGNEYYSQGNEPKCVPRDCLEPITGQSQHREWYQKWSNTSHMVLDDAQKGYNLFRFNNAKPFYKIKEKCLEKQSVDNSLKTPEPEFESLGIGWYGHPYKLEPKYSIFAFLGLVPEGIIVHQGTDRRFYIIHYGGEDVNKYLVLEYKDETAKYESALEVNASPTSGRIKLKDISRKDPRQQWKIIFPNSDKRFIKFQSIYNSRYLYLGLDPKKGTSIFSTIPNTEVSTSTEIDINSSFSFISTFGTQLNILDTSTSAKKNN